MAFKNILCIIKTTQYERWESLQKENQHHTEFVQKVKSLLKGMNVVYSRLMKKGKFDLVITCGGDGTFLAAAEKVGKTPILGLNSNYHKDPKSGSIGALTSVDIRNVERRLGKLREGKYNIKKLKRLQVKINGKIVPRAAFNEMYVGNSTPFKSTDIEVRYKQKVERFNCSGVLVCSSTGSKAWFRNAGGRPFKGEKMGFLIREPNLDRKPAFVKGKCRNLVIIPNAPGHVIAFDSKDNVVSLKSYDKVQIMLDEKKSLNVVRF
jgi:NAD kinase